MKTTPKAFPRDRPRRFLRCMVLSGMMIGVTALPSAAPIYECRDADGHPTFTDRGCPGQQIYIPSSNPPVHFAPLSENDLKRLELTTERNRRMHAKLRNNRAAQTAALVEQAKKQRRLCKQATAELKSLLTARRKGYALKNQPDLDTREAALKQTRRANC